MGSLVKGMDPFSLASSGVSSIFNLGSQIATNKANMRMNADNIAAAYNMQDKANDFSREMFVAQNQEYDRRFDKESQYNSAASQRSRLEAAGLNPYLMMSGGSAGVGSSTPVSAPSGAAGSVPASIPKNALRMEFDANNVRQAVDTEKAKEEVGVVKAEKKIAQANAAVAQTRAQAEIDEILSRRDGNNAGARKNNAEAHVIEQTTDSLIAKAGADVDYQNALVEGQRLSNQISQAGLPFVAPMQAANLQLTLQKVLNEKETRKLIQANTNESKARAKLAIEQAFSETLKQEGLRLDNNQKRELMQYVIHDAMVNSSLLDFEEASVARDASRTTRRDNAFFGLGGDLTNFGEFLQEFVGIKNLFRFGK